jgi:nitroimidazol reductase NimA-like FMN-containing flavoprotein (pyridoxamine 5'-phosphate oxidase superfamily)
MEKDPISTLSAYINEHPLAVLSTINGDGSPHGTTLYAGSDSELNIYFMTKRQTTKSANISANPHVALTFSGEDHQTTLQVSGIASEVTVPNEGATAFQVLGSVRHNAEDFRLPISKIEAGPYIVYKVNVTHALLSEYEHGNRIDGYAKVEYKR